VERGWKVEFGVLPVIGMSRFFRPWSLLLVGAQVGILLELFTKPKNHFSDKSPCQTLEFKIKALHGSMGGGPLIIRVDYLSSIII
jgi:hypothetical protein